MNTTFTQKHSEEVPIYGLSKEQFVHVAAKASKSLGWQITNVFDYGFTAYTSNGVFNWNAEVKLRVNDNIAKLISQSRNIRSIEIDRDKKNLEVLLAKIDALKESKLDVEIAPSYMNVA